MPQIPLPATLVLITCLNFLFAGYLTTVIYSKELGKPLGWFSKLLLLIPPFAIVWTILCWVLGVIVNYFKK